MLQALGFEILKALGFLHLKSPGVLYSLNSLIFESPGFVNFEDFFKNFVKFKRSGLGSRPEAQL